MTELEEITAWLNSRPRDFDRGLMLYIAYFDDANTKLILERHRSDSRLFEILRKRYYALKGPDESSSASATKPLVQKIESDRIEVKEHTLPEEMRQRWKELKTEQERWSIQISLIFERKPFGESDRKQCAQLALMVYNHQLELDKLGMAMEHYKEHGALPADFLLKKKPVVKKRAKSISKLNDIEKVLKLKNSINPGLSKLKKKIADKKAELSGLEGKAHERAIAKLKEWEEEEEDLLLQKKELTGGKE